MSWIKIIPYEQATGLLLKLYDRLGGAKGDVDNVLRIHSLRPHTLEGHMTLYKYVLHHSGNETPKWLLEAIGTYVSILNGCTYCEMHHGTGLRRLLQDDKRTDDILAALRAREPSQAFQGFDLAALIYAGKLTQEPGALKESDLDDLRANGAGDGQILEINQVASYFSYANRTVLGLGVTLEEKSLGLSPGGEDESWDHS